MSFNQRHTEETKKKISAAMKGRKHPRYGAEWTSEQRIKFQLTVYNRQREETLLRLFLEKYQKQWLEFQQTTKV